MIDFSRGRGPIDSAGRCESPPLDRASEGVLPPIPPVPTLSTHDVSNASRGVGSVASNPFCTRFVQPGALSYRFSGADKKSEADESQQRRRELLQRLMRCRRSLIIGPHGSGKTTLLYSLLPTLGRHFEPIVTIRLSCPVANGFRSWSQEARKNATTIFSQQAELTRGGLLVVDGLEQLSCAARLRMRSTARRHRHWVLGTSHRPLAGFTELCRTGVTRPLIESLAESLLADADAPVAARIRQELKGRDLDRVVNLRDLWFEMYDVVAKMEACRPAGVASLHASGDRRSNAPICPDCISEPTRGAAH